MDCYYRMHCPLPTLQLACGRLSTGAGAYLQSRWRGGSRHWTMEIYGDLGDSRDICAKRRLFPNLSPPHWALRHHHHPLQCPATFHPKGWGIPIIMETQCLESWQAYTGCLTNTDDWLPWRWDGYIRTEKTGGEVGGTTREGIKGFSQKLPNQFLHLSLFLPCIQSEFKHFSSFYSDSSLVHSKGLKSWSLQK